MENQQNTQVGEMKPIIRTVGEEGPREEKPQIQWRTREKRHWGEELLKNMGVAAALVLCAVAVRSGEWTDAQWTDTVLTAATGDMLMDDQLGKLTFVSSLFRRQPLCLGRRRWKPWPRLCQGAR